MGKTEDYVKEILAEATEEDIDNLTNFLKGPLINLYTLDGPTLQSVHRVYMQTVFKHRETYRAIVNSEIAEMQAEHERKQAEMEANAEVDAGIPEAPEIVDAEFVEKVVEE